MKNIYFDNKIDLKARNIFLEGFNLYNVRSIKLIYVMLAGKLDFFCFRYIRLTKTHHYIKYMFLINFFFITGGKMIWIMHNAVEHKSSMPHLVQKVQDLLFAKVVKIFILHEDMIQYIPASYHKKVVVISFGPMLNDLVASKPKNQEFVSILETWEAKSHFNLLSVSTASKTDIELLVNILPDELSLLDINPDGSAMKVNRNIFRYNGAVYQELSDIVQYSDAPIWGLVLHNNGSVATSLYQFVELGIPVIALEDTPNASIIRENGIGFVVNDVSEITAKKCFDYQTYDYFLKNVANMKRNLSWAVTQRKVRDALL